MRVSVFYKYIHIYIYLFRHYFYSWSLQNKDRICNAYEWVISSVILCNFSTCIFWNAEQLSRFYAWAFSWQIHAFSQCSLSVIHCLRFEWCLSFLFVCVCVSLWLTFVSMFITQLYQGYAQMKNFGWAYMGSNDSPSMVNIIFWQYLSLEKQTEALDPFFLSFISISVTPKCPVS